MKKFKSFLLSILTITSMIFFTACPKTPTTPPSPVVPVDDATQVMASVVGIVTDETNIPIQGAVVTSGTATVTTDAFGSFSFNNISLSKNNGSVSITKVGYFKGIRSFISTAGKQHQIKLQLMKKGLPLTVSGATGGVITSNGGATINFPAAAFVTNGGAPFTGTVNVYSRWIDPTASNLPFVILGDLRGVNTNGAESVLETFGMVGAELEDASGNKLKIAPGVNATVNFPIPASLMATAPSTIPLWHFDDATARWREDGSATKSGSNYIALVNKFSFWNVDVPNALVYINFTLMGGSPSLPITANTRIKRVSNGIVNYGITNDAGYASGGVPKNEALILEVLSSCGTIVYSQNISASNIDINLGTIMLPAAQIATFSGTIVNCTGVPIANGKFYLYNGSGIRLEAIANTSGIFNLATIACVGTFSFQGFDNSTNTLSVLQTTSNASGNNALGIISVCNSTTEYIKFTMGGAGTPSYFSDDYTSGITVFNLFSTFTPSFTHEMQVSAINPTSGNSVTFELLHNNSISGGGYLKGLIINGGLPTVSSLFPSTPMAPMYTQFGTTIGSYVEGSIGVRVTNPVIVSPTVQWTTAQMYFRLKRTN